MAAALLPILMLGAVQTAVAFNREAELLRESLGSAAQRSAADARARMESADILLETLAPGSVGFACARRLAEVTARIPGYDNLIRFDRNGRVACAAGTVPSDPGRSERPWFAQLRTVDDMIITRDPGVSYSDQPALVAAVPARNAAGEFDGALAAVIALSSLQPGRAASALPEGAEVALVDNAGRYLSMTNAGAFAPPPKDWLARTRSAGSYVWYAQAGGERRVHIAAPLVGESLFVILSAQSPSLFSWARLNPLTGLVLPLMTFVVVLVTVFIAADRVVVRWLIYLQRIAALYARGRLTVRPARAEDMPAEIRDLAETLEDMADAIVGRDASLRDSLAQKDALLREIHHRVKNNLQVISSLLSMQQRALSDPGARAAMSDTRQRISALALVYRALYQGPDLKRVDLRPFLEELTAQLVAGESMRGPPVRTELHADALMIDPDRLAPLALFAVEAITNAQKHAFADRGGTLSVDFRTANGEAVLEIADDGVATEQALAGTGVGRTLMTAFARQLRGAAEVLRNASGGVTVRLVFPTPPPEAMEDTERNQAVA
ncbi:sensor histidine kinase [Phenylobacterium sp.]|uniref:sensor histidine kinase PhyK n=1 Tax=Phenylobacterium sp. TaxID=1871053 RepID=UPI00272F17DB|nr:sensor histidine kinase [Phenylobacterium sp.]MDP1617076.1 sensor histidine kinase [Phenylobacterium sp.]MDP1989243.1 sensor histidine kinase [Phenylobacterium sp.]